MVIKRRTHNRVEGLLSRGGKWIEDPEEIENTFKQHFMSISNHHFLTTVEQIDNDLRTIELSVLNSSHLSSLNAIFTREEVYKAIIQLGPLKEPGPDGKPAIFYQKY